MVLLHLSNPGWFGLERRADGAGQWAGLADSLQQNYSANSIPLQYIIGDVILVSYSLFSEGGKMQNETGIMQN